MYLVGYDDMTAQNEILEKSVGASEIVGGGLSLLRTLAEIGHGHPLSAIFFGGLSYLLLKDGSNRFATKPQFRD
jgi:hypothetical protein